MVVVVDTNVMLSALRSAVAGCAAFSVRLANGEIRTGGDGGDHCWSMKRSPRSAVDSAFCREGLMHWLSLGSAQLMDSMEARASVVSIPSDDQF
jgi:hypothetical protein